MDNFKEIAEVYRRASLVSITKPDELVDKLSKDKQNPNDTWYMVHVLILLFGVLNMLAFTFFTTANDYWMYKFRDTAKDTVDLNNKTSLQKYFVSGISIVQSVPSVATMLLSTIYGHRFKVNSRIILTLIVMNAIFAIFTVFIKINTDAWQVVFFAVTLLALSILTGFLNLFQVTSTLIIPKFPAIYMKTFLFGQGLAPIFSASLQIVCLALGTSSETSALLYFIVGTLVILFTLILYLLVRRMTFYKYYMQIELEDTKKKFSKEDIKSTFFQTWPCLALFFIIFLTIYLTHPCITSLVVSEHYGNGNKWNDVYFVPAVTYLFSESCSQFGRLFSKPIITESNGSWIVGLVTLRMIVLVPLVWFCNAQPRNNIPVLFSHDWQYILVIVAYFVSSGYLTNVPNLSIPRLAKGKEDIAYLILLSVIGLQAAVLSPVSVLAVRIL